VTSRFLSARICAIGGFYARLLSLAKPQAMRSVFGAIGRDVLFELCSDRLVWWNEKRK
jgi:hypothetical protein